MVSSGRHYPDFDSVLGIPVQKLIIDKDLNIRDRDRLIITLDRLKRQRNCLAKNKKDKRQRNQLSYNQIVADRVYSSAVVIKKKLQKKYFNLAL